MISAVGDRLNAGQLIDCIEIDVLEIGSFQISVEQSELA